MDRVLGVAQPYCFGVRILSEHKKGPMMTLGCWLANVYSSASVTLKRGLQVHTEVSRENGDPFSHFTSIFGAPGA